METPSANAENGLLLDTGCGAVFAAPAAANGVGTAAGNAVGLKIRPAGKAGLETAAYAGWPGNCSCVGTGTCARHGCAAKKEQKMTVQQTIPQLPEWPPLRAKLKIRVFNVFYLAQ
jgi:hypothetical protein